MALGDPTTARGLLTILFTEVAMLVLFHGTAVGPETLGLFGLEDTLHLSHA